MEFEEFKFPKYLEKHDDKNEDKTQVKLHEIYIDHFNQQTQTIHSKINEFNHSNNESEVERIKLESSKEQTYGQNEILEKAMILFPEQKLCSNNINIKKCDQDVQSSSVILKKKEMKFILKIPNESDNLFNLFCDLPVKIAHFLKEAEGQTVQVRSCLYNTIKRVTAIRTFYSGMMIEAEVVGNRPSQTNFNYLVHILRSKGNKSLYELAGMIETYGQKVTLIAEQANNLSKRLNSDILQTLSLDDSFNNDNTVMNWSPQDKEMNQFDKIKIKMQTINSKVQIFQEKNNNLKIQEQLSFLDRRRIASNEKKETILMSRDPQKQIYFKSFQAEWDQQQIFNLNGYGFAKGYCELMGVSVVEYKNYILRHGFLEGLDYSNKLKGQLRFFSNVPWEVKEKPIESSFSMKFISFDGIQFDGILNVITFNLSNDFDREYGFECDICDILLLMTIQTTPQVDAMIANIRKNPQKNNILRLNQLKQKLYSDPDIKNQFSSDQNYSQDTIAFLERYYKDIYGQSYFSKKLRKCGYIDIPCKNSQIQNPSIE